MELNDRFALFDDEYLKFDRIESPVHELPDMCAFLMLHKLAPVKRGRDMVCGAEHDEIYLATNCEALNASASDDDIRDLVRCGVRYDEENDSLCMFA